MIVELFPAPVPPLWHTNAVHYCRAVREYSGLLVGALVEPLYTYCWAASLQCSGKATSSVIALYSCYAGGTAVEHLAYALLCYLHRLARIYNIGNVYHAVAIYSIAGGAEVVVAHVGGVGVVAVSDNLFG